MENSNLQFYENLHRKYFNKAKDNKQKLQIIFEDEKDNCKLKSEIQKVITKPVEPLGEETCKSQINEKL